MLQVCDQIADSFPCFIGLSRRNEQLDRQIGAVVEVVVFAQRAVARRFNRQGRYDAALVEADAFVDDVFIAPHVAVMDEMKLILQKGRQLIRRDRVRDDGAARIVRSQDGRHHGDEGVAVDGFTIGQDGAHAVYVRIEDEAQIGMVVENSFADRRHGLFIFRIRNMIGEHAVRFEELTARRIGAEDVEDLRGKEAACAVAGIDDDAHAFQGLAVRASAYAAADFGAQVLGIYIDNRQRLHAGHIAVCFVQRRRPGQDVFNISLFQTAVFRKEFQAVAVVRQMAGRNHDGSVHMGRFEDNRHEHSRRRGQSAVKSSYAAGAKAFQHGLLHRAGRNTRIMADSNAQAVDRFARLFR